MLTTARRKRFADSGLRRTRRRPFDTEVAARRSLQATALSVGGVFGVGASALAMLNAVDTHASAPVGWAVVFFGSAQASAACMFLAVLRAAAMRREIASPDEVRLLCRRNTMALSFALLALFAVGAALPGQTAAWKVLAGPTIAVIAASSVTRVRWLTRKLDPHRSSIVRTPLRRRDSCRSLHRRTGVPLAFRRGPAARGPARRGRSFSRGTCLTTAQWPLRARPQPSKQR